MTQIPFIPYTALIPLYRRGGQIRAYALVDEDLAEMLSEFRWTLSPSGYARSGWYENGKQKSKLMHRLVLPVPENLLPDHINGNPLDNRRCNLRLATPSQNAVNRRLRRVGWRGVQQTGQRFVAMIRYARKTYYLGCFGTQDEAARAYDAAARELHGSFAHLNFPDT